MSLVMPNGSPQPAQQGAYQNAANSQYQSAQNQLQAGYRQYLGRDMNQDDFHSQTSGGRHYQQNNVNHALNNIQNSDEARAYQARQNQPQQQAPPTGQQPPPQQNSGGGGQSYPSAPNVPATYAAPNLNQMMQSAGASAPQIQNGYKAQQVQQFQGKEITPPQYTQTVFGQFQQPQNQQIQGQKNNVLMNLLQNPESLNQQWQDQMFEQQKDQALDMAKQFGLQNQQALAGRGIFGGDGQAQFAQQQLQSDLMGQLLSGRRQIATQAATQNRQDVLNALGAEEAGLSGDMSRATQGYQAQLAGQQAQAGENQFAANYGLGSQQAVSQNNQQNYNSYLAGMGLQGQENARQEQFAQSAFGLNNQSRQNAMQMALQGFLGQDSSELGWANYGLNADGQFLNYLNGIG